jgi:hypothetical protein
MEPSTGGSTRLAVTDPREEELDSAAGSGHRSAVVVGATIPRGRTEPSGWRGTGPGQEQTLVLRRPGPAVAWTADIRTVKTAGRMPGNDDGSGQPRQPQLSLGHRGSAKNRKPWKVNASPACLISRPCGLPDPLAFAP